MSEDTILGLWFGGYFVVVLCSIFGFWVRSKVQDRLGTTPYLDFWEMAGPSPWFASLLWPLAIVVYGISLLLKRVTPAVESLADNIADRLTGTENEEENTLLRPVDKGRT